MSLRSHLGLFCSIFILFLNVGLTPGRESWLVIVHFKWASPLQRLQALPWPHYWRRNITSLDISGLPHYWRRNTSHFTCSSQRAHPAVQWIPVGSFEASPHYRSVGYPVASPCFPLCRLWQQTGFVCGVGVLSVSTCVLEFLGMLCHLMLPHMLSMDWILGMFV